MKLFSCIILILLLSSCSTTYYYSTLSTKDGYVQKVENGDFLVETDALWIAYCFKGEGAPVQITIFNKMQWPLFVKWSQSALTINGELFPYTGVETSLYEGEGNTSKVDYEYGVKNGYIEMSDTVSTIPPNTMLSNIPIYLNADLSKLEGVKYRGAKMENKQGVLKTIKNADFEEGDSPLRFTSSLVIYTSKEKPISLEQTFFISNLINTTKIKPENISEALSDKGNVFHYVKESEF